MGRVYSAQANYRASVATLETAAAYPPDSTELLIDLAIAYFHAEQYEKAMQPVSKVLARDTANSAAHHMAGKIHFMLGDFARSTSELETAFKMAPNDNDVAYTLGLAYLKQHQFTPAKRIYDRMVQKLGDRPQLRVVFGRAYRETDFLSEAIEEFKRAVSLDPNFPRAHYYLGLTYLLKDGAVRLDDAAEEFKIELRAHPDEFFANYYLGVVYNILRKWELAISFLEKASRIQPNNSDPYFHLGEAYQGVGKHDRAIEVIKKAIALNPYLSHNDYQVTTAHYRLGQSLLKIGRTEEGEKELQVAADLKLKAKKRDEEKTEAFLNAVNPHEQNSKFPELVLVEGIIAESNAPDEKTSQELKSSGAYYAKVIASAHNNIGMLRAQRQDYRAAVAQFATASKWDPQLDGLDFNWGLACFKAELYKEGFSPLENELKAHPANLAAKQLLGLSYFMTDNYPRASVLLREVVSAKPTEATLYYPLTVSLIKQGMRDQANQVIRQMVAMGGNSPQFHILLGRAHYELGDTTKALEELQTALSLDNRLPLAHFYAGLIYIKLGKLDDAAREFESESILNPSDLQAKYHLAYVWLSRQETERGIKLMREVIRIKPDFGDARFELGKALLLQGNIAGAVESLEIAAKLQPDQPHVHYQLGRAYVAAGRKTEGESQLEIARQLKEKARAQTNQ
jgi:tetratricopeptide (TPR) repeat protein